VRLGARLPLAPAARERGRPSRAPAGVLASESVAGRLAGAAGAAYVAEPAAAVAALERQPRPEPAGPAVLRISAAGAMIAPVGEQWVAAETPAIGRVVRAADGTARAPDLSCFSRRAEHPAFRRPSPVETDRRGAGTAPTGEGIATRAHALKHDGPDRALAAPRAPPSGEQRATDPGYPGPRPARLRCPTFRAAGYPIGSGIVESATEAVVADRLTGGGPHRAPRSVDPLRASRTIVCADRRAGARPRISARLRADARTRRRHLQATRRAARQVARAASRAPAHPAPASPATPPAVTSPATPTPPTPETIVDGHPTKAHPSNRRFRPHRPAPPAED
jgi:hypothetical protein